MYTGITWNLLSRIYILSIIIIIKKIKLYDIVLLFYAMSVQAINVNGNQKILKTVS